MEQWSSTKIHENYETDTTIMGSRFGRDNLLLFLFLSIENEARSLNLKSTVVPDDACQIFGGGSWRRHNLCINYA